MTRPPVTLLVFQIACIEAIRAGSLPPLSEWEYDPLRCCYQHAGYTLTERVVVESGLR